MNSLLSFAALAAYVVGGAMAQSDTALFTNMTFDTVMVGQQLPIYWTAGNGEDVSLTIGNSSWNETIFGRFLMMRHDKNALLIGRRRSACTSGIFFMDCRST